MDMDFYLDSTQDALFVEIERRLLLLISEGEEEEEERLLHVKNDLYALDMKSECCNYRSSHPVKDPFGVHTAVKKPVNGTGVFIPHLASTVPLAVRPSGDRRRRSRRRAGNVKRNGR